MKIYVGNLEFGVKEIDLQDLFKQYGSIDSVAIVRDAKSQKSKGFGFVEMPFESEAENAISCLDGLDLMGRELIVNQAVKRERTPQKKKAKIESNKQAKPAQNSKQKRSVNNDSKNKNKKLSNVERKASKKGSRGANRNEQSGKNSLTGKKKKLRGKRAVN